MSSLGKVYNNYLETLIGIFTIEKADIKVLLFRKKTEPYKGYWILPGSIVRNDETLEDNITDAVLDKTGLLNVYIEQCYTFSNLDRAPEARIIATSFIGLVDSKSVEIKREERPEYETAWFSINELPKLGYDHENILARNIEYLKKRLINVNTLKSLFPSDFTLPELQSVYEQIYGREIDRRNFRKKIDALNLIEDTLEKNTGGHGRPAKLYRFKEDIKDINLYV